MGATMCVAVLALTWHRNLFKITGMDKLRGKTSLLKSPCTLQITGLTKKVGVRCLGECVLHFMLIIVVIDICSGWAESVIWCDCVDTLFYHSQSDVVSWVIRVKGMNFFLQQLQPVAIMFILCRIGPLIRHWCMRYEAKHNYFKRLVKNAWNSRNIGKTLASRHQRLMCYYLNSAEEGHSFLDETISTGRGKLHCTCIGIVIIARLWY